MRDERGFDFWLVTQFFDESHSLTRLSAVDVERRGGDKDANHSLGLFIGFRIRCLFLMIHSLYTISR